MNLQFNSTEATLSPAGNRIINVSADGVESSEILDHFTVEEVIKHFDERDLLFAIGRDAALDYFGVE